MSRKTDRRGTRAASRRYESELPLGRKASKRLRQRAGLPVMMGEKRGEGAKSVGRAGLARHGASAAFTRCLLFAMAEPRLRPATEPTLNTRAARHSVLARLVHDCCRPARGHCQLTPGRSRPPRRFAGAERASAIACRGSPIACSGRFRPVSRRRRPGMAGGRQSMPASSGSMACLPPCSAPCASVSRTASATPWAAPASCAIWV